MTPGDLWNMDRADLVALVLTAEKGNDEKRQIICDIEVEERKLREANGLIQTEISALRACRDKLREANERLKKCYEDANARIAKLQETLTYAESWRVAHNLTVGHIEIPTCWTRSVTNIVNPTMTIFPVVQLDNQTRKKLDIALGISTVDPLIQLDL